MTRIWTLTLLALTIAPATVALANHDTPLYRAADYYRDAVREFETHSDRARYLDSYTERAIDRLNSAANLLRTAARDPRNTDRLLDRYYDVVGLQDRIEATLFSSGYADPRLSACWTDVRRAFTILSTHLELGGAYGGAVTRLPQTLDPGYAYGGYRSSSVPITPNVPQTIPVPPPISVPPITSPRTLAVPPIFSATPRGITVDDYRAYSPLDSAPRRTPSGLPQSCDRFDTRDFDYRSSLYRSSVPAPYGTRHIHAPEHSRRVTRSPAGDLITIGAQLMRLMD
ncbi:hypothetical protein [Crateriforma conspicua]|uniref:hypothetical protein n=1 Tax=Crateriforma conspicua TaxID=2527996 RepID=UPI00118C7379|nr:hypothetical protein [Crateriforma conspicua]QDV61519.1 hypothetical protein Mal65_06440 [Crateriforma conspicua]